MTAPITSRRIGLPEHMPEAANYFICKICGGTVDKRDAEAVLAHQQEGQHPGSEWASVQ